MRSYAASKGIKVIGLTNDKLKELLNLPEIGDKVTFSKRKDSPPVQAVYKGYFKCKKTDIFYAKLQDSGKKKYIKQLSKINKIVEACESN
jgi:hypothetical protein